jgi:hypothetical protein
MTIDHGNDGQDQDELLSHDFSPRSASIWH